jgi:hypothetical protein
LKWIDFNKKKPEYGKDVLVLKTYLDAPYGEHGYENDKSFWIDPVPQIDCFWSDNKWNLGGKALYWLSIPEKPNEIAYI